MVKFDISNNKYLTFAIYEINVGISLLDNIQANSLPTKMLEGAKAIDGMFAFWFGNILSSLIYSLA